MMRSSLAASIRVVAVCVALPAGAAAQAIPEVPAWTTRVLPLHPIADLERPLRVAAPLPDLLLWPEPRVGLTWTAGNPGALALEVDDARSMMQLGAGGSRGEYRRPLDPERETYRTAAGSGWRRLGDRGAANGRVLVANDALAGAPADRVGPYTLSPFVPMDTVAADLGRIAATLEGAAGWGFGRLGAGVSLGYRSEILRTEAAPVPRTISSARPAVGAGIVWEFGPALRMGVAGRWTGDAQRTTMYAVAAPSRVYQLRGYSDPPALNITTLYRRRLDREAGELSGSAAGTVLGTDWAVVLARGILEERQSSQGSNDPPLDTWDASSSDGRAAVQRSLPIAGAELTAEVRYTKLSGDAVLADIDSLIFAAEETVIGGEAELRLRPAARWTAAARLSLGHDRRRAADRLVSLASDLTSVSRGLGLEVAREFTPRAAISLGIARSEHLAAGAVPNPLALGPVFRRYVAPALMLYASDAAVNEGRMTAGWEGRANTSFWLQAAYSALAPIGGGSRLPLLPDGDRTGWRISIGALQRR